MSERSRRVNETSIIIELEDVTREMAAGHYREDNHVALTKIPVANLWSLTSIA